MKLDIPLSDLELGIAPKFPRITVEAVATTCPRLRSINLSYTGVNAAALLSARTELSQP